MQAMIALAVVAAGVALVAAALAWSLAQPRTRCAWCGEPTRGKALFCCWDHQTEWMEGTR